MYRHGYLSMYNINTEVRYGSVMPTTPASKETT